MARSMTGFGLASSVDGETSVEVTVRSVNNRYFKLQLRCPLSLASRESALERLVRQHVSRGTVSVSIQLDTAEPSLPFRIVPGALRRYHAQARKAAQAMSLEPPDDLSAYLPLPGVVEEAPVPPLDDQTWQRVAHTVKQALESLQESRAAEGKHLAETLGARASDMQRQVTALRARAPRVPQDYRDRLEGRLSALLPDGSRMGLTDGELAREVAFLADRCDVTEELDRLDGHLRRFQEVLGADGEVGRKLEFLAQEMLREANTVAAKAGDQELVHDVVDLKCDVERLKEQLQNVE